MIKTTDSRSAGRATKQRGEVVEMERTWDKYLKQGIFAALFVSLLFYTMNENKVRESELKQIVKTQTEANAKFADLIKVDLQEIKSEVRMIGKERK